MSKADRSEWYAAHPNYHREYYVAHREESLAKGREARAANPAPKTIARRNRVAALENGDRFFVGGPCPKGHELRYTSSKTCVECGAAHMKARNSDRQKATAIIAKWRADYPEKAKAAYRVNHDRRRQANGFCSRREAQDIRESQGDSCGSCRVPLNGRGHLDHIMPIKLGGSNDAINRQWLCADCNHRKHGKDPRQFCRETGLMFLCWSQF